MMMFYSYSNKNNCNFLKLFILLLIIFINFIKYTQQCDIVGASACPHKPENDLKDENFEEYCKKYKEHIECVYKKYNGCDRKEKYVEAMESMVKGLRKKAKQIGDLCELEIDVPIVTPKPVDNNGLRNNGHTTKRNANNHKNDGNNHKANNHKHNNNKNDNNNNNNDDDDYDRPPDRGFPQSSGPPCRINTISIDCHPILTNVQFNPQWNGQLKQKWCNQATAYHICIKARLQNCVGVQFMESLSYYDKIEKYIHSQSNVNCPGGLEGCAANPNDVRCKLGVKYGEVNSGVRTYYYNNTFTHFYFLIIFFIYKLLAC